MTTPPESRRQRCGRDLQVVGVVLGVVAILWVPFGCIGWNLVTMRMESAAMTNLSIVIPFLLIPASLVVYEHGQRLRDVVPRHGRCPHCGYDLNRTVESGCPECGWNRDGEGLRGDGVRARNG